MQMFWEIAPPETWALLGAASTLLLAGFVLLSHSLVRSKSYGDEITGVLAQGRLEWTLRVGVGCLAFGAALWGVVWGWPTGALVVVAAVGAAAVGLEGAARLRH
jgi:hypothetical protein